MNSSTKNYLIIFLLVVAVGGGALAWQQYLELVTLRAGAVSPADLAVRQKQLTDAQRYAHELEDQLATVRDSNQTGAGATANARNNGNANGGRGRGGQDNNFRALMETPEVRKLVTQQQRAQLDTRYAALFKALNLPAAQLDKFKSLLLEKQSAMQDVFASARDNGLDPRTDPEGFRKLVATTQADLDANLKAVIGDDAFTQYQQYQQTQPQRNVLTQLQQSLSYTDAPLTDTQSAQLLQILASTSTAEAGRGGPPDGGGRGGPGGGGGTGPTATITTQTIAAAQTVLSATQVDALTQLQQTQQAQQQLEQLMRANGGGGNGGGRGARGTPTSGG